MAVSESPAGGLRMTSRLGQWDPFRNRIDLQEEAPDDRKIETFFHEVVHSILTGYDKWDEELAANALGEGLALFIKMNPDVIRDILDTYKNMEENPNA